jgi:hypothetical protein
MNELTVRVYCAMLNAGTARGNRQPLSCPLPSTSIYHYFHHLGTIVAEPGFAATEARRGARALADRKSC